MTENNQGGGRLSTKERVSFIVGGFGQNLLITFVTTFMMVYLVEGVGISNQGILTVTGIITAAKIWDAINDPIAGVLVDKTRSRFGKLRPYILFTAVPIAFFATMIFAIPEAEESVQLAFFGVAYILWGMTYTLCDVSFWGMSSSICENGEDRTSLISQVRTFGTVALGAATLFGGQLAKLLSFAETTSRQGWTRAALLISVIGMGLFVLVFFNTREKSISENPVSLKEVVKTAFKNKPLGFVLLGSIFGFGRTVIQVGGAVAALIVFGDEGVFTYLGAGIIVGMLIATISAPYILKKMSDKKLIIYSSFASVAVYVVMFILGYQNIWLFIGLLVIAGVMTGFFTVCQTTMIAATVDYSEKKTGRRDEGVSFSCLTFSGKLMGALSTLVFGLILYAVQYEKGVVVTPEIRNGVFFSITIIPAISCLLGAIPFFFFNTKIDDEKISENAPMGE